MFYQTLRCKFDGIYDIDMLENDLFFAVRFKRRKEKYLFRKTLLIRPSLMTKCVSHTIETFININVLQIIEHSNFIEVFDHL
jgi:hypothetical protein